MVELNENLLGKKEELVAFNNQDADKSHALNESFIENARKRERESAKGEC